MKHFYVLMLAAAIVATTLPEIEAVYGLGGGRRMRRNGMEGMHRFGRDIDHMLGIHGAEDEVEQAHGLGGAFEDDLGILPGFEGSFGSYRIGDHRRRKDDGDDKDLGITFDE